MAAENEAGLDPLLDYLKRTRGFDFNAYKRPSLARRIQRRMQMVAVQSYADYVDFLEVRPDEFQQLFNTILINVTAFFRDPQSWEYLATEIVPRIVHAKAALEPIRVWSAGCASGEEAYTLAMVFHDAVGPADFRERVKIYASNVDEAALTKARHAAYMDRETEGIPQEQLEKYFERNGDQLVFNKDLRRSVIFGRHDLIQDAPISRVDLLVCRNTLMYFNAEAQAKVLARFHFAMNDNAYLFLGKAEMLLNHAHSFAPIDLKRRIFAKVAQANLRDRLLLLAHAGREDAANQFADQMKLRDSAFDADVVAQIVFDNAGILVLANDSARALLGLGVKDLGRPLADLEIAYKPVDLRSHVNQVQAERRPVLLRGVAFPTPNGGARYLDVRVLPLFDGGIVSLGTKVAFDDVTIDRQVEESMLQLRQDLETMREELETTNEELETTNEELESTNEELQSTNEELETMNEELQSSNEELRTMNDEIVRRGDELNQVNAFLESILTSLRGGVIVTDRDLRVQVWNERATDLWGLRAEEVHEKALFGLDIGFPLEELRQPIRACLGGDSNHHEVLVPATNRRGKKIRCRVTTTPLLGLDQQSRGVILLMEDADEARQ
ncbi:MAG: CheR family methyltransferase [Candidatus Binatia bacterium]